MTVVLRVGRGIEGIGGLDLIPPELAEWATVSAAVGSMTGEARTIVRLRGERLAGRYAAELQVDVAVVDDADVRVFSDHEPTPWLTGLVIAGFTVTVVVVALVALAPGWLRSTHCSRSGRTWWWSAVWRRRSGCVGGCRCGAGSPSAPWSGRCWRGSGCC